MEWYTPGLGEGPVAFMRRRRAASAAAFLLPLLRPEMRLLDCGCGPGTVTLDLARLLRRGSVVGVDSDVAQTGGVRLAAERDGLPLTFVAASVYRLPFGDATFDVVFAHALFEHLAYPERALREMRRVLRPDGLIALRSPDWGGFLVAPDRPETLRALRDYEALQRANGGDPRAGRKLGACLRAAHFRMTRVSASYEVYDEAATIADYLAGTLEAGFSGEAGRTAAAALRAWSGDSNAFFAQAWVEAIGARV